MASIYLDEEFLDLFFNLINWSFAGPITFININLLIYNNYFFDRLFCKILLHFLSNIVIIINVVIPLITQLKFLFKYPFLWIDIYYV